MSLKSLIKINLNDCQNAFLICSYKPAQKLRITLLNLSESKAFTGYATDHDLRTQAATIHMIFSDFISLTKKALIRNELGTEQFLYSIEKSHVDMLFKWKSVDEEETIINIGSIKVTESDYEPTLKTVFLILSEEMLTLNKKVLTLEAELSNVKNEKEDALQLLSDVTDVKDRVEKELYSKFMIVLNEKKQKIRELKYSAHDELPCKAKFEKDKKKRVKVVHRISESSDETTSDVERMNVAGPSTSNYNKSDLFPSDEELDHIRVSPSKQRIRNKATINKTLNLLENKSTLKDIPMESESEDELFKDF